MQGQTFYEVLGVERTASRDAIRTAYRALAKRYHPDAHPDHPEYEEILKGITGAYAVLSNELKRAKYDLGLASGTDSAPLEPEDLWEPSPEELRDIYALDEEARTKEIERLCGLHPHLRQFFENRPPPPRFKPSDTYVAEFRSKDKAWRLSEIERQCARHPHLRAWFGDLAADCERAEEEHARRIERERARAEQYEAERPLLALAAFSALGGALGLFVGFLPAWIIGGVVGVFSGEWSADVERHQAAFRSESSWFWFLWISCGLVGAAFLGIGQLSERWLESPSRDLTWTRVKALLIAVPCIVAITTMISMRSAEMSRTADHRDAVVQKKRAPVVVVETKPLRITAVAVDGLQLRPNSPPDVAKFTSNRLPLFAVDYDNAHPGDRMSIHLVRTFGSYVSSSGESVGDCGSDPLASHGRWTCQWSRSLEPGYYLFDVRVNGQYANAYYFVLAEARQ